MAGINKEHLIRTDKERNYVHKNVQATYTVFEVEGKKYFQIDTFGREERKIPGKTSQSIQFDRETAEYLLDLLKREFNI